MARSRCRVDDSLCPTPKLLHFLHSLTQMEPRSGITHTPGQRARQAFKALYHKYKPTDSLLIAPPGSLSCTSSTTRDRSLHRLPARHLPLAARSRQSGYRAPPRENRSESPSSLPCRCSPFAPSTFAGLACLEVRCQRLTLLPCRFEDTSGVCLALSYLSSVLSLAAFLPPTKRTTAPVNGRYKPQGGVPNTFYLPGSHTVLTFLEVALSRVRCLSSSLSASISPCLSVCLPVSVCA